MRAFSKYLIVAIEPRERNLHIASPFLYYKLGFECVFLFTILQGKLWMHGNLGTLSWMFSRGRWIDFFSRW